MKPLMTIKFWGVRGSIPSPGDSTVRYGGNTSCVSVDPGTDKILVFDAGTGIRALGKDIIEGHAITIYILPSHNHWDHIQGFPFFAPLYKSNKKIILLPTLHGEELMCSLVEQMDGANIARIATNHPGGGYGYRIANEGRSIVYITDNELDPPYKKTTEFEEFIRFCSFADILVHDAQYIEHDMPKKHGWGHSLVSQVCELAKAASVKHVVLFHHDPDRTDDEIDSIQDKARYWFKENGAGINCTAAYEGLELTI
jgi:phosphoribosyl 1,2-cyclic phosphodiesterase